MLRREVALERPPFCWAILRRYLIAQPASIWTLCRRECCLNENVLWEAMWWRGWEIADAWGVLYDALEITRMSSLRRGECSISSARFSDVSSG